MKQAALEKRELSAPTRSFLHGLNISGKTIVAPDSYGSGGLVGLEAATGKPLWRAQGVLGSHVTPLAWSQDGKDYVITATDRGVVTCLRADDGAVAWTYDKAGAFGGTPLLTGDLLIVPKLAEEQRKALPKEGPGDAPASAPGENVGQVACLALSPRGAVEKWVSPVAWGAPWYSPVGTATGEWICFRGNYRYHIVNAATGERLASTVLSAAVRWDEGTMLALPGLFIPHPDSQHGSTKLFTIPAAVGAPCGPMWSPPHPHATTYEVAMSHAWVDGRLFIRGADAVYCYDLRKPGPARQ
jgi:outer membrane protein assembly factor BamB